MNDVAARRAVDNAVPVSTNIIEHYLKRGKGEVLRMPETKRTIKVFSVSSPLFPKFCRGVLEGKKCPIRSIGIGAKAKMVK